MIESMYKLYLIIHNDNVKDTLNKLQDLGAVHINKKEIDQQLFAKKLRLITRTEEFIKYYSNYNLTEIKQVSYDGDLVVLLQSYTNHIEEHNVLDLEKSKLERLIVALQPWGDFSSQMIGRLKENGIYLNYYVVPHAAFDKVDLANFDFEVISEEGGKVHFITVHRSGDPQELALEKLIMPTMGLQECHDELSKVESKIRRVQNDLDSLAIFNKYVEDNSRRLKEQVLFSEVQHTLDTHYDSICSVTGWIPESKVQAVRNGLDRISGIVFHIDGEISSEEIAQVPIVLKNGKFSRLFEPITKLFSFPGYGEYDLTPFFAPFFVMFFGLCLGDAGYGLAIMIATIIGYFKLPKARSLMILGFILSLSTIFWGLLTGTTFGIDIFKTPLPILSNLALFPPEHTFYLALLIGLFQILFGMTVQFLQRFSQQGPLAALSPLGWMILLIFLVIAYLGKQQGGGDFAIGVAIINFCRSVPLQSAYTGMGIGAALILFFNDMKVNIFLRLGKGLWELYGITGVFGDLLSYIRLFALGISSAILGTVINSIGQQLLKIEVPILSHLLFVLFLVGGHTGNLLLASLGSFVHPLRLTFVEFYKNAGFAGGGKPYSPFKRYHLDNVKK